MLTNTLNGLAYGSLLFVLAAGLLLVYGLRRVVNFSHGALYMLGAYIGYSAAVQFGFAAGFIAAGVALALVGVALDMLVFRQLKGRNPIVTVIVTFGVFLILEDFVKTIWGTRSYTLDPPQLLAGVVNVAGAPFPAYRLFIIGVSAVLVSALMLWLHRTRMGLCVRAASQDAQVAAMWGVRTDWLGPAVVGLGAAFAGLSGVLAAPFLSIHPGMGSEVLVLSFVVSVIGGLGSLGGAFISALLLGQVQAFGTVYLPELAALFPFIAMAGVLIFRPQGIGGGRHA